MSATHTKTLQEITERILRDRAQQPQLLDRMKQRQEEGWQVAREATRILKTEFGVKKVVLYGSMLNADEMTVHSDIDLAVWGLGKFDLFKAGARIEQGHDFEIDLVPIEIAKPHIIAGIEEGTEL